jgi:hypothetical protein
MMLELISQVLTRWSDQADITVIGGDFNASCRPRVGYVGYAGTVATRSADARLDEWYRQKGLACAASLHSTWQSVNESRYAVLDCFFWQSKTFEWCGMMRESFPPVIPRISSAQSSAMHLAIQF